MASQRRDHDDLDADAWARAEDQFAHLRTVLPQDAVGHVAREVVRRLAFRMPKHGTGTTTPPAQDIARFVETLLAGPDTGAETFIAGLRRGGTSVREIYMSFIAAAARELGRRWDRDEISFAAVTTASGRLYRIIRGLRHVLDRTADLGPQDGRIVLALLPGDTHTLGSEMAADLLRRAGWTVDLSVGEDHDTVVARAEAARAAAIVLVANADRELAQLTRLVIGLRIVVPMTPVVLAGKILDMPDVARLCGVDDVVGSLEAVSDRLRRIVGDAAEPARRDPPPRN